MQCENTFWRYGKEERCEGEAKYEFGYDVIGTFSLDGENRQEEDQGEHRKLCEKCYRMEVYILNKEAGRVS